ncbi:hypothetical protein VTN00DRAFT_8645 [Thermoascus crustaceus]|uniref:uncharacterized protein n=1 Tax=Thermoascus crustaceus TaxID=5088 RepID=UPI00374285BC
MEPLITIVGATGTGKSKIARDRSGDSLQWRDYQRCVGLDEEPWRIGTFRKESLRLIKEIHSRGKLPILVGGTHYYTQAVLFNDTLVGEGVVEEDQGVEKEQKGIPSDSEMWSILDAPADVMQQKLREVDPAMADRWHPNDARKIRRSLEIYLQTGRPASEIYAEQKRQKQAVAESKHELEAVNGHGTEGAGQLRFPTVLFWVHSEKEKLNSRLDKRVDAMIEQGLLAEARKMWDYIQEKQSQGITVDKTRGVWISIGFKELEPYLNALREGTASEKELEALKQSCIESVKTSTRQYSGKQVRWIRNKLWNALAEADMTHRLYVLDSSDVDDWTRRVTEPSERVVHAFLSNEPFPDPKSLSELARVTLSEKEQQSPSPADDVAKCITCEVCRKTMTSQKQWDIHINGHAHKRALKAAAKRAQREEFLRSRSAPKEDADGSTKDETT